MQTLFSEDLEPRPDFCIFFLRSSPFFLGRFQRTTRRFRQSPYSIRFFVAEVCFSTLYRRRFCMDKLREFPNAPIQGRHRR